MTILAIETATAVCAVAVLTKGALRSEASVEGRGLHAERLLGMIESALEEAAVTPQDLTAVAVSIGPGSFTGLRIGLSVAKGLVFGLQIGLAAVPTLEALAWRLAGDQQGNGPAYILAALDARRDEVYCQLFRHTNRGPVGEGLPEDLPVSRVRAILEGKEVTLTGDGAEKVLGGLSDRSGVTLAPPDRRGCSAATVGLLGERMLLEGRGAEPATVEPQYIKEFFLRGPVKLKGGE